MKNTNTQSGNVFIYIFLAIALFGALTFALSQGTRSGASSLTEEQASIAANEILAYSDLISQTIQKLKLRGCTDTEISFENSFDSNYDNPNSPTDGRCGVFDVNGGALNWKEIPENARDTSFKGTDTKYGQVIYTDEFCIPGLGSATFGCAFSGNSSDKSLAIGFSYIRKEVCMALNRLLNLPDDPGGEDVWIDQNSIILDNRFHGTYTTSTAGMPDSPAPTQYAQNFIWGGQETSMCARLNGNSRWQAGSYQFVSAILIR